MISTLDRVGDQLSVDGWVEAAPFRAHLRHLMAVADLSPAAVAVLVGISPSLAHRLLHGRGGRPVRRVNPDTARRLLRVTSADARAVRRRVVSARPTVHHLHQLRRAGWSDGELSQLLGIGPQVLASLLNDVGEQSCTQLVALRAAAEVSLLLTVLPRQAVSADRAA